MITEEMLKQAAEKANQALIESIPDNAGKEHVFSNKYERKMKRLTAKANHPVFYASMRTVAGFILILLLGGSLLFATKEEVRAKVIEWIKTQTGNLTIYKFEGEESNQVVIPEFELGYVPEEYILDSSYSDNIHVSKIYVNHKGELLNIICVKNEQNSILAIDTNNCEKEYVTLNNSIAELYISKKEAAPNLIWLDEKHQILYSISGYLEVDELIKITENLKLE